MSTELITGGLSLTARAVLATGIRIVTRTDRPADHEGATLTWSPASLATDPCEPDAEEQAALDAATDHIAATVAAAAADVPADLAPRPDDDRRGLSPLWHELVTPPATPELHLDRLPVVPGRKPSPGHRPRHLDLGDGETTVEWVAPGWMPPIGARRLALITGNTPGFEAVRDA